MLAWPGTVIDIMTALHGPSWPLMARHSIHGAGANSSQDLAVPPDITSIFISDNIFGPWK